MDLTSMSHRLHGAVFEEVDHIGIAVNSIDETLNKWEALFGVKVEHIETVEEHFVRVAFVPMGGVLVEFLEPTEPGVGVIGEFLEKHGEGFNHIAFRVNDLKSLLATVKKEGVALSKIYHQDDEPRRGSRGSLIAFLAQEETNDVFIELVEMRGEKESTEC
jgi:methylmalonyl-CoA/ethylmalonyl-CoA epimerase